MNYDWMDQYLLQKPGAVKDNQWGARYQVGDKMFALWGSDKEERPLISLKLAPERGELLRREYSSIVPGYYLNKVHWNSVYLDDTVPNDLIRALIDESYGLVFSGLSKKRQAELRGDIP